MRIHFFHQIRIGNETGFSITELLIAMAAFVLVISSAVSVFIPMVNQSKQQGKILETQIEGLIGLDILRRDVGNAGYGLPWNNIPNYNEAVSDASTTPNPNTLNDAPSAPPRAIVSDDNTSVNESDYLVIKSAAVATNNPAHKWTYIVTGNDPRKWGNTDEDLENTDKVIVIRPVASASRFRELIMVGTDFFTTFNDAAFPTDFSPFDPNEKFLIFGIGATDPRMPFNRADYYINADTDFRPLRCASGTGVLVKRVLNQGDGIRGAGLPLLDCVADFQVQYDRDSDGDGIVDTASVNDVSGLAADEIRNQVKAVRISILAHEGQMDPYFTFNGASLINIGNHNIDLTTLVGTDWMRYRWKVYTIIINPENLE